jgi:uncharacterized membrane protein YhdT
MLPEFYKIIVALIILIYCVSRLVAAYRSKFKVTFMGITYYRNKHCILYFLVLLGLVCLSVAAGFIILRGFGFIKGVV